MVLVPGDVLIYIYNIWQLIRFGSSSASILFGLLVGFLFRSAVTHANATITECTTSFHTVYPDDGLRFSTLFPRDHLTLSATIAAACPNNFSTAPQVATTEHCLLISIHSVLYTGSLFFYELLRVIHNRRCVTFSVIVGLHV